MKTPRQRFGPDRSCTARARWSHSFYYHSSSKVQKQSETMAVRGSLGFPKASRKMEAQHSVWASDPPCFTILLDEV